MGTISSPQPLLLQLFALLLQEEKLFVDNKLKICLFVLYDKQNDHYTKWQMAYFNDEGARTF